MGNNLSATASTNPDPFAVSHGRCNANPDNFLEEVDDNCWILGRVIISRHASKPLSGAYWGDGIGGFFSISKVPNPRPQTREEISAACPIVHICSWAYPQGTWRIGPCELKIGRYQPNSTCEHVILEDLRKVNWSFQVPQHTYHHAQHGSLAEKLGYILCHNIAYSTPAGSSLCEVWPAIKDEALKERYVRQIAQAYGELSKWYGEGVCNFNDNGLEDRYLGQGNKLQVLRSIWKEYDMDSSDLVFAHNYMHPHAFIVDGDGLVGITNWEIAGYVPRDWIRSKARVDSRLFRRGCIAKWSEEQRNEWEGKINTALRELKVDGKTFGIKYF
ncbi:hypothetical protein ACHAPT_006762 [Fusarium lateritium]